MALVAEKGPEGFTLREAARAVGVNHAAVYRHFADKRALLADLAAEGFRGLAEAIHAALAAAPAHDAIARLRAIGTAYVAFALADPARFRLISGPRLNEDGRHPELEDAVAQAVTILVAEVREGIDAHLLRTGRVRDIGFSLLTMAHGYADLVLARRIRVRSTAVAIEHFATLVEPLLAGLRPPGR